MRQRIITGTLLALVLAALVYFGEGRLAFLFSGACVLLATGAAIEFTRMSRHGQAIRWFDWLAVVFTAVFATLSVIYFKNSQYFLLVFLFLLGLFLVYALIFVAIPAFTRADFGHQILTIFYTSLGFIAFAYLRTLGMNLIIYLFIVAMLTDVFAYFIGIRFGKHRLAPRVSPKKSVEGAIGGLVFSSVLGALFGYYFQVFNESFIVILLLSMGLSILSQMGDLIASKFKREADIKDYSQLFPGHGGILDRFDSSMFAAVFLMLFMLWM